MNLSPAIADAKKNGRLGLIIYTIPGFPSASDYTSFHAWCEATDFVSVIETTIPVTFGYSDHANETIRKAHKIAAAESDEAMVYNRTKKPNLLVLYKSTVEASSFEEVCKRSSGIFDAMILEWSEPNEAPFVETAAKHGIELVQCIGPWMTPERIQEIMRLAKPDGLIYLMSAEMTGAALFSKEQLATCIAQARETRPDVVIAAGFGVRTEADVKFLATVPGLDAVIIGTQLLQYLEKGTAEAKTFLEGIGRALPRER